MVQLLPLFPSIEQIEVFLFGIKLFDGALAGRAVVG